MTISKTADHILSHPYFSEACESVLAGNSSDMRILLIDLMAHVAMSQNGLDARIYMKRRECTYPNINSAIRENACGCDLFFHLPTPHRSVQLSLELDKKDTSQLELELAEKKCVVINISNEQQQIAL